MLLFLQQDRREEQTVFKWEEEIQHGPQKGELRSVCMCVSQTKINLK